MGFGGKPAFSSKVLAACEEELKLNLATVIGLIVSAADAGNVIVAVVVDVEEVVDGIADGVVIELEMLDLTLFSNLLTGLIRTTCLHLLIKDPKKDPLFRSVTFNNIF